jgi:phospholipid/cholesterol/gamma-HCH transport system substrate-binding protein
MKNEVKVGILAVVTLTLAIWGYFFLKGRNLLSRDKIVFVEYNNVNMLTTSSPVLLNGAEIGVVSTITLHPTDVKKMIVGLTLKRDLPIPKNAIATLIPTGITGGKAIELTFDKPCSGGDCVTYGDYLVGKKQSMLGSYIEPGEIDVYMERIKNGIGGVTDSLNASINDPSGKNGIGKTFKDIELTVANLKNVTNSLAKLIEAQRGTLGKTMANIQSTTDNLAQSNAKITEIISNSNDFTKKLGKTDIDGTVASANEAIKNLQKTLNSTDSAIKDVNSLIAGVNRGEGSLGSLLKDDKLAKNLEKASKDLDLMLQDIRLYPRRYINLSIFGKNGKTNYEYPNGDPANVNEIKKN